MRYVHKNKRFFEYMASVHPGFVRNFQRACAAEYHDTHTTYVVVASDSYAHPDAQWRVFIPKTDIREYEDLKTGVWYRRKRFDGNPHGYHLYERVGNGKAQRTGDGCFARHLRDETEYFMYSENEVL